MLKDLDHLHNMNVEPFNSSYDTTASVDWSKAVALAELFESHDGVKWTRETRKEKRNTIYKTLRHLRG